MKIKSLLLLALVLILGTFTLASCDAVDGVLDKIGELPVIGDLPFFDEEVTTAPNVTTDPSVTTTAPDVTTSEPDVTTSEPDVTEPIEPEDPFKDVALAGGEFTYNGEAKTIAVTGLPEGATVTYAYAKGNAAATAEAPVNAGVYTVTATISLNGESVTKTATLTIKRAVVDMSAVLFKNGESSEYNPALDPERDLVYSADNLPEGVLASYAYVLNGEAVPYMKNAGVYTVTASFELDEEAGYTEENYELSLAAKTITYTIAKKAVAVGATFGDSFATYTGTAMTYEAATGFDTTLFTVEYSYSGNMTDVGEYTVTATFALKDKANYAIDGAATETAVFTINKAEIDLSGIAFPAAGTNYFNGQPFTYEVENIPEGVELDKYTYILNGGEVEALKDIGEYTVYATFKSANYVIPEGFKVEGEFEILKTLADMSTVKLDKLTLVYNGALQEYKVEGVPAGITATPSYTLGGQAANPKDVATYEVLIKFTSDGYTIPDEWKMKTATLEIVQKEVSLSGVTFVGGSFGYTGSEQGYNAAIGDDIALFDVTYETSGDNVNVTEDGYTVTATFTLKDTKNYKLVGETNKIPATYKITPKKVTLENVIFVGGEYVYDGNEKGYTEATKLPEGVTVEYSVADQDLVNAGSFTVTATFKADQNHEIEGETTKTATYVIKKAPINLSGVSFPDSIGNVYTGSAQIYEAAEKYGSLTVKYNYSADMINVGTYTVTAVFTNGDNYESNTMTATYTIVAKQVSIADLEIPENPWNVEGATKFAAGYAFQQSESGFEMVFTEETVALLTAEGLTVSYKTEKLPFSSFANPTEVIGPATAPGDYETTATFAVVSANYELVGETTMSILWGIYTAEDGVWSPTIK